VSKLGFIVFGSAYMIIMALVIDSIDMEQYTAEGGGLGSLPSNPEASVNQVFSMMRTFINMMFFQVEGVPYILNVPYTLIAVGMAFIIVNIIKDLIPFT